ncbi:MAG: hypothetical protein WB699_03895 [Bacteroidota bacterium]
MIAHLDTIEIAMLVLGIAFFVILSYGVWKAIQKGKKMTWLLPFFAVAIIMIGFPAYKSVKFAGVELDLQEAVTAAEQNPANTQAKEVVRKRLADLGSVSSGDLDARLLIARAYNTLGERKLAISQVDSVLKADPTHLDAQKYKRKFEAEIAHP